MWFCVSQLDRDFLENMEDFVTLDELAEDEDEAGGESGSIGTRFCFYFREPTVFEARRCR